MSQTQSTSQGALFHVLNCLETMERDVATATFRAFSDSILRGMAREMRFINDRDRRPPTTEDTRVLFELAAVKLDGSQLERLTRIFDDHDDVLALTMAVATLGAAKTRFEFAAALAPRVKPPLADTPRPAGSRLPDTIGLAIGVLLVSLKDHMPVFERTIRLLTSNQLACVCIAGTGPHLLHDADDPDAEHPLVCYDPSVLHGILVAATMCENLYLRCVVLDAATGALILMRDDPHALLPYEAVSMAEEGLSRLLDSGFSEVSDAPGAGLRTGH